MQSSTTERYDLAEVKSAAHGKWKFVISTICGIRSGALTTTEKPCPWCGGTGRFSVYKNFDETGGLRCNQCFHGARTGDGFAAIMRAENCKFPEAIAKVAELLGVPPTKKESPKRSSKKDPAKHLKLVEWNDLLAATFCMNKPGITIDGLKRAGAKQAKYRNEYQVIALPIGSKNGEPVGWCLYNLLGGELPTFDKNMKVTGKVKVKNTTGSSAGVIGVLRKGDSLAIKTEGPTDMLAILSLSDLPDDTSVFCNAFGAMEVPKNTEWIQDEVAGFDVWVIHDCDEPGQRGATEVARENGPSRPGWAPALARKAKSCRNVVLPYPIEKSKGKDLRDWLNEGNTFVDLQRLAETMPLIEPVEPLKPELNEAADDPHRLAEVNRRRYREEEQGEIVIRKDEWFTWTKRRGRYRTISKSELRAKVTKAIKEEFNRYWEIDVEQYEAWCKSDKYDEVKDKGPPMVRKVTFQLVGSVLQALSGEWISEHTPLMTWLEKDAENIRDYLAFKNGIIDVRDTLATGEPKLIEHSPKWFSTVVIPYDFDPKAECPLWEAFLEKNLELDPERIKLLQEWAGYLLLPDTGQQKFLVLKGEGSNGKSVFIAGIIAMLGMDNCSQIPLEMFSDRFQKTETLGKLVNIMPDTGAVDGINEGVIKSFTSGDVMYFDRKGISGTSQVPTARIMLACNEEPRFSDKSSGLWRRMMVVPWNVEIQDHEKVANMDKHTWWIEKGEAAGIMRWAMQGLKRLQDQGRFTYSAKSVEEVAKYRRAMSPTRDFLESEIQSSTTEHIETAELYDHYKKWCEENGHRVSSKTSLTKELQQIYSEAGRVKVTLCEGRRVWAYAGVEWRDEDEIEAETQDSDDINEL